MEKRKKRVEVVLTEADIDIIEFMEKSTMQNATQFKVAMRAYMQRQEEERFDERVKRLIAELLVDQGGVVTSPKKVESKSRVGFGAKKI